VEAIRSFFMTAPTVPDATDAWTLLVIVGLGAITILTRAFFFISEREWSLPPNAQRGLQYAPIAALAAVIAPEVLMRDGAFVTTFADARIWGSVAGAAYFFVRRAYKPTHSGVLGTIVCGLAVFLPLRLGLGW
jgi:branched-subunit amino acid transport protein